jgi:hypothetical protein
MDFRAANDIKADAKSAIWRKVAARETNNSVEPP